jgi:hypothetical protein
MSADLLTARAIKSTALLEETRALLRLWNPGDSPTQLRQRVLADGALGKSTASRAADVVDHAFSQRLLVKGDEPARTLKALLAARGAGKWLPDLLLLASARADSTLRAVVTEFLPECVQQGVLVVDTRRLVAWLGLQCQAGRSQKQWSSSVQERVAQHILHSLSDLAVVGSSSRGRRALLPFRPSLVAVAVLTWDLHRQGLADGAIADHRDWALWQQERSQVLDAWTQLAELGLWELQAAGDVVRIDWAHAQWPAALAAIGGLPLE